MRYQSVNAIKDFEFHDSYVESGNPCKGTPLLMMYALNIYKNLPQNPSNSDMKIKPARLCNVIWPITTQQIRKFGKTARSLPQKNRVALRLIGFYCARPFSAE